MTLRYQVLTGPTAAGKTALLLDAAAAAGGLLVISADSRQVYRDMNIGTGKASAGERDALPHRVIDVADPGDEFSAYDFVQHAAGALGEARESGLVPWVCGGTGLYIRALIQHLAFGGAPRRHLRTAIQEALEREAPRELASRLGLELREADNPVRVLRAAESACGADPDRRPQIYSLLGLDPEMQQDDDRESQDQQLPGPVRQELERWECAGVYVLDPGKPELERRIRRRVSAMFDHGLLDEVSRLRALGFGEVDVVRDGIAYREAAAMLDGGMSQQSAVERAVIRTRQYAKRQRTYSRGQGWAVTHPALITSAVAQNLRLPR